ncbi:hypothetical protein HY629_02355 [Candidatus Uhrbacteria bacterium]|nr:hypothetical protein [Candidatus Uhrbacteria bacterium]
MGTNFYVKDDPDPAAATDVPEDEQEQWEAEEGSQIRRHLGKRSASGLYCYDCDISLATGAPGGMNPAKNPHMNTGPGYKECPGCGKQRTNTALFNPELWKPTPEEIVAEHASPVRYSHSFSYAKPPEEIAAFPDDTIVIDEYGRTSTMAEFRREVIEKATFLFTHSVGVVFS